MKKITFLLFLLFAFNAVLKAQPCSNFNSTIGNWTITNGWTSLRSTNPIDGSQYLSFGSINVPSNAILANSIDFRNLGTTFLNQCIRFDYNVYNDGVNSLSPAIFPRIYLTDGTNIIWWQSSTSIIENSGTGWVSLRAPIQLTSSSTSPLPSNSNGTWMMTPGMSNTAFNNVMLNSTSVYFMSLASSGATSQYPNLAQEDLWIDNVCIVNCGAPCTTFDDTPPAGNWVNNFCTSRYTDINPGDGSNCATLRDNAGPSWYTNSVDYNNLGTNYLHKCLCFDYYVENDGFPTSSTAIFPTIYFFLGSQWIAFQSKTSILERDPWVHLCANIETATSSTLPETPEGRWIMDPIMTWSDFNNVLLNNTSIGFSVDVAGSTAQTEDIRIDNICVVDCPNPCNANFEFKYIVNTMLSYTYNASIELASYKPSSTYIVDWGDGARTTLPPFGVVAFQHLYAPGSYTVCVTEIMADRTRCTKCIRICIPERLPDVIHGGDGTKGEETGGSTSMQRQNNNNNTIEPASNEIQMKLKNEINDILEVYPNPTSDNTKIDFKIETPAKVSIKVLDLLGKVVLDLPSQQYEIGNQTTSLNTRNLTSGIYTIVLTIGEQEISKKLSIIK